MPPPNPIDIRQTPQYAKFMQALGWQSKQAQVGSNKFWYFVKSFKPLPFTFIKIHRPPVKVPVHIVKKIAKANQTFMVKISPAEIARKKDSLVEFNKPLVWNFFIPNKLKYDKSHLIATKTIWIDLTSKQTKLMANLKQKTRYNIRKAVKNKLKVKIISGDKIKQAEVKNIYQIWRLNNKKNHLYTPSLHNFSSLIRSFGQKSFIVLIKHKNNTIAFCLVLLSSNMAFYWHNASTKTGKKLFAPNLYAWQAIIESKKRGVKIFDFEGIFDNRFAS
jgi:lipid II:glycine glycyltransferase (peptidoglycan interpeptide bridge formation enzyme)